MILTSHNHYLYILSSRSEAGDDSASEFCECIETLAVKVGLLSSQRAEFLERSTKAEAANKQLDKELEEKKELVNTLYVKLNLEKQVAIILHFSSSFHYTNHFI